MKTRELILVAAFAGAVCYGTVTAADLDPLFAADDPLAITLSAPPAAI